MSRMGPKTMVGTCQNQGHGSKCSCWKTLHTGTQQELKETECAIIKWALVGSSCSEEQHAELAATIFKP